MNRSRVAARAAWVGVCLLTTIRLSGAQTLPPPWSARDIGAPALTGAATASGGVITIDAGGVEIGGRSDEFHFVYQAVTGDVDIRARIDGLTGHEWSKAGVMVRRHLSAASAHAYAFVSTDRGAGFHRRVEDGGATTASSGPAVGAPYWVRLTRTGTSLTAYTSADGTTWAAIGSETIELGATAYAGLAVTARHGDLRASAALSSISVTTGAAPPASGTLPQGESQVDIGSPPVTGGASYANGRYIVSGSGGNIWDSADQFHYVYQPASGDLDVVARVASIAGTHNWSKAGVMIRESLAAGSRHAVILASVGNGYAFQRRVETDGWSTHSDVGGGTAPGWLRLVRKGGVITAYRSSDGAAWTAVGSDTILMGATVYVGLAVTSHDLTAATTAIFDNLRISLTPTASNHPPSVILTSPVDGAAYPDPATVTIDATATDIDGRVERVEFYADGALLGRDGTAPYTWTSPFAAGTHAITALAVDDQGASAVSDAISITVSPAAGGLPRFVAFTASADHATLVTKYVLEVYAAGSRPGEARPLAVSDLGKPVPAAGGDIVVDRWAFFQGLAPGTYLAAVSAVGTNGVSRTTPVTFTR